MTVPAGHVKDPFAEPCCVADETCQGIAMQYPIAGEDGNMVTLCEAHAARSFGLGP